MIEKKCIFCNRVFVPKRLSGEKLGIRQALKVKFCSRDCFAQNNKILNTVRFEDGFAYLSLRGPENLESKVDEEDYGKIRFFTWRFSDQGYVVAMVKKESKNKLIRLHHLIFGKKEGFDVDHKNRNKLDNRKGNLRFLTRSQNNFNKEGQHGINQTPSKRWMVVLGKTYLGSFKTYNEALSRRLEAEDKFFKGVKVC